VGKKRQHDLDPLLRHWRDERELARQSLIQHLDSDGYRRFVEEFGRFLNSEGAGVEPVPSGEPVRYQVRHVLGSQVWLLYETILAYENVLDDAPVSTLHLLRIDCKRLRYTLEFFQEILGPDTPWLIKAVIAIQDHLGDLQDATVASSMLSDFLVHWHANSTQEEVAGVALYLAYRRKEARRLIDTLPRAWPRIASLRFRRRLANALMTL
jgi:CHAD domain-containing protein